MSLCRASIQLDNSPLILFSFYVTSLSPPPLTLASPYLPSACIITQTEVFSFLGTFPQITACESFCSWAATFLPHITPHILSSLSGRCITKAWNSILLSELLCQSCPLERRCWNRVKSTQDLLGIIPGRKKREKASLAGGAVGSWIDLI